METESVALDVKEVLAPDEVHTMTPGFEVIEIDELIELETGIDKFSENIDSPSNKHMISPSKSESPELFETKFQEIIEPG